MVVKGLYLLTNICDLISNDTRSIANSLLTLVSYSYINSLSCQSVFLDLL